MRTWDVVVIGSGIIGTVAAHWLARNGMRVALVEQGSPLRGTSGSTHSNLSLHNRMPGPEFEISLRTRAMYKEIYDEGLQGAEFKTTGGMLLVRHAEEMQEAASRAKAQVDGGLPVDLIEGSALRELDPHVHPDVAGAIYCSLSGMIYAPGVCYDLLDQGRKLGIEFMPYTRVSGFRMQGERVVGVDTSAGTLHCGAVLIAAGVQAGKLAGMAGASLTIFPHRGHIIVTEKISPMGVAMKGEFVSKRGVEYPDTPAGREQRSMSARMVWTQTPKGYLMLGRTGELGRDDRHEGIVALRSVLGRAAMWVPSVRGVRVLRVYTGARPYSSDGLPVVDAAPGVSGLWLAAGFGDKGVGLAFSARLLAEQIIHGRRDNLLNPFQYDRPTLQPTVVVQPH